LIKCPRCATTVQDEVPKCAQCGFGIEDLDQKLGPLPATQGVVSDFAGVLSAESKTKLEARLTEFEKRAGAQLRLVTRDTTAPGSPAEYAFWLFNRWNIGDLAGDENKGILVLLAKQERQITCEVGFGLEELVTDEAAGAILDAHVVPFLAKGQTDEGAWMAMDTLAKLVEGGEDRRSWWRRLLGR
jgi:uncharacterized protein